MEMPKYIDNALRLRTSHAILLSRYMGIVDKWLDKNGIICEACDTHTGCEIYCNPTASEMRIREMIENHEN